MGIFALSFINLSGVLEYSLTNFLLCPKCDFTHPLSICFCSNNHATNPNAPFSSNTLPLAPYTLVYTIGFIIASLRDSSSFIVLSSYNADKASNQDTSCTSVALLPLPVIVPERTTDLSAPSNKNTKVL